MKIEDKLKDFSLLYYDPSKHAEDTERGLRIVADIKEHSISSFNVNSPAYATAREKLSDIYNVYLSDLMKKKFDRYITANDIKKARNATTSALKALEGIPEQVKIQLMRIIRQEIKCGTPIHDPFEDLAWIQLVLQKSNFRPNVAKGAKRQKARKRLIASLYHFLADYVSEAIPTQGTRVEGLCVVTGKHEEIFVNPYHERIFVLAHVLDQDITRENISGALKMLKAKQKK